MGSPWRSRTCAPLPDTSGFEFNGYRFTETLIVYFDMEEVRFMARINKFFLSEILHKQIRTQRMH
jgi:hypothetical protein